VTDAVQIELIRAAALLIPSALSAYSAYRSHLAEKTTADTKVEMGKVRQSMDGLLDARVKAAKDLGTMEGHEAGVKEEKDAHA